ncbi:adhesin [Pseudomonas sp. CNPSo 3701]|uniref:adhesin n=1 Tax=Pseudomonas sp. CNPSo 3701 TaxID=3027943 RepID=UPI002363CC6E|nr:adhesin [Pseudomonas sp. CNPSo 3701]MDD1507486.1 adhesin [Pseudomonas sp. CNPSo 3701]
MRSCILLISLALSGLVQADDDARIDAAGSAYQGNLSVNQAAGDLQQQANVRVISVGGTGVSASTVRQSIDQLPAGSAARNTQANIDGNAFSGGNGVVGVTQAAGVGNQQVNVLSVTLLAAPQSLDDSVLAQSVTRADESFSATPVGERRAQMSNEAFSGSRGVVQLNQSSGIGNRTANHLSIRVVD